MSEGRYYCRDQPRSIVERISNVLIEPWIKVTDSALSLFVHPTHEAPRGPVTWDMLLGLPLLALSLACLPLALLGYLLRVCVCAWHTDRLPYRYLHVPTAPRTQGDDNDDHGAEKAFASEMDDRASSILRPKDHLVFMTANVLMSYDLIVRFNNGIPIRERLSVVASRLTAQNAQLNLKPNLCDSVARLATKESVVISQLPVVDVLLLQEVMGEEVGRQLAQRLSSSYAHFLYDVAENSYAGNLWLAGSGLFLASKLRIECAHFRPFTHTTGVGRIACYGALLAKLDASPLVPNGVVYVTNVHNQAYDETLLYHAASEAQRWTSEFILATKKAGEKILCTIYGGDFNGDNISPADGPLQQHPVWREYVDACRAAAGADQPWAVGTEMRQKKMYFPSVKVPETFAEVLRDDVRRRYFVIDADVKAHTYDLMSCEPAPDTDGQVRAKSWGGLRRIDRLLLHTSKTFPVNSTSSKTNPELSGELDNSSVSATNSICRSSSETEDDRQGGVLRRRKKSETQKLEGLESSKSLDVKQSKNAETEERTEHFSGENIPDSSISGFEKLYGKHYRDIEDADLPVIESVWFPTVLSSLTDHIPYIVQVKVSSKV